MSKSHSKGNTPMTPKAAVRIQSKHAKSSGGNVAKGTFAARATSAAAKNTGGNKK